MAATVLISVEGVISDRSDAPLSGAGKLDQGVALFHCLATQFHVALSTLEPDEDKATSWLRQIAGIQTNQWARLLRATEHEALIGDSAPVRRRHLLETRATGYDLRFFADPDPKVALSSLLAGVTPLCCPHPLYARESFLPAANEGRLSWDAIADRVITQRLQHTTDPRLQPVEDDYDDEEDFV